jgi:hypothetical protein
MHVLKRASGQKLIGNQCSLLTNNWASAGWCLIRKTTLVTQPIKPFHERLA